MRCIIARRAYDTETAQKLAIDCSENGAGDECWWAEELYRKSNGEFFVHGAGGAETSWAGSEGIRPLTLQEAWDWAEAHLDAATYENILGEVSEDEKLIAIATLRVRLIGDSLGFYMTRELKNAGINQDDLVRVTVERIDG